MSVGSNIRRARRAADLSQDQLAKRLGVSRATIGNWESGETTPRGDEVFELLGIDPPDRSAVPADDAAGTVPDGPGAPLDVDALADLTETALVLRAQRLAAETQMVLTELATRVTSGHVPTVTPPSRSDHPRLRSGPLDPQDRPSTEAG